MGKKEDDWLKKDTLIAGYKDESKRFYEENLRLKSKYENLELDFHKVEYEKRLFF